MKQIKKLKKKLSKLATKAKEKLSSIKLPKIKLPKLTGSATRVVSGTAKLTLLFVFVILTGLSANRFHVKYLEHKVGQNTVFIRSMPDAEEQASGTGFEMKTPSGRVVTVTNRHICELQNSKGELAVLEKQHSNRLIPLRVIEMSKDNDVCIVEGLAGYEGLDAASGELEVGEPVFALGYPLGQALNFSAGRVKDFGPIFLLDETTDISECNGPKQKVQTLQSAFGPVQVCTISFDSIQTDLVIFGGNSGSAMVNIYGNVVGIIFAGNNRTNWGSSVPLSYIKDLLKAY